LFAFREFSPSLSVLIGGKSPHSLLFSRSPSPVASGVKYRHITYFDASAAVKLVVTEPTGSGNVRAHFAEHHRFYMTSLCFAEALGVLKRKMLRDQLIKDAYFSACYVLIAYLRSGRICLEETPTNPEIFMQAEDLARQYGLDLSDAFQIITVKHGKFKNWATESKTVLATADIDLEKAAEKEGLRVWNVERTPKPPEVSC
jgi:predicted nucleic acid-binding protein